MIFNQADSPVSNLDAGIDFGGHRWAFRAFFPSSFPGTDWGNLGSGYLSRLMAAWWRFDRLDRPRSIASIFSDQGIDRQRARVSIADGIQTSRRPRCYGPISLSEP